MSFFDHHPFSRRHTPPAFWLIYVLSVIFNFHELLVAYSNSTYMEAFATPTAISVMYTIGSALSVLAFLFISRVLRRLGNVRLTLWLSGFEIIALLLMGFSQHAPTTIIAFVTFLFIGPLIYLNIDIFSESLIGNNESATGSKRGLALSLMSLASALGPFTVALVVGNNAQHLYLTYVIAALVFSSFIFLILRHFHTFTDPVYHNVNVLEALRGFWIVPNLRFVFLAHFLLQLFFSWTIIYIPLYLATGLGYGWDVVGSIIGVALLAYVVFEYPIGLIADRYIGEKEMMATGFMILAITVSWISFMATASILAWMILMFINRFGASLVEVTTESYFFKHTKGTDANVIGFFRLTRPLALVAGSLLGSISLLYVPFNLIFVVLGFVMVAGIFFVIPLEDTK